MQPQAVYSYDFYLSEVTNRNIFVSADMAPDI